MIGCTRTKGRGGWCNERTTIQAAAIHECVKRLHLPTIACQFADVAEQAVHKREESSGLFRSGYIERPRSKRE